MKFAKEIEQELVPEWRAKYLNYKLGKKKVKAISRALRNCHQSPRTPGLRRISTFTPSPNNAAPSYSFLNRLGRTSTVDSAAPNLPHDAPRNIETSTAGGVEGAHRSSPQEIRSRGTPRESLIKKSPDGADAPALTRYGSIIGSPPRRSGGIPTLNLPDPAVDPDRNTVSSGWHQGEPPSPPKAGPAPGPSAFEIGKTRSPVKPTLPAKYASIFRPKRVNSMPGTAALDASSDARPSVRRMLSLGPDGGVPQSTPGKDSDVPLEAYRELDVRQAEFFNFLDQELEKIEDFYKDKEDEATKRLEVLREQLHIMRDRRLDEIISKLQKSKVKTLSNGLFDSEGSDDKANGNGVMSQTWLRPFDDAIEAAKKLPEVVKGKPKPMSKNARAMQDLGTPCGPVPQDRRDYVRRPESPGVPYRTAKRKLKTALQEYYRGLELLKAYALLNRTAFRKINKKYDKTVMARPTMRYMNEKVNNAWFVKSDIIDGHLHVVEDLYARYFYRGNHKIAVGKLRIKSAKAGDFTGSTFRNGLMLATGTVFGCEGIAYASKYVLDDDSRYGGDSMYIYWPVVLIGLTVLVIFLPAPFLYHRSRRWFAYSNCLRRYYDTRNFFPHLVNCGKYTWTIMYYMSLSLYRIHKSWHLRTLFIFCATVNAVYCSIWDLVMDWSLMNPYAKKPFLRDNLGYKNVYWYYVAIVLDPILRFNWIFYAIYGDDYQHSAILSFMVSLSEIFRRGMWTLFRVENEHCTNVVKYRASRDVPLPYSVPVSTRESLEQGDGPAALRPSTPQALESQVSGATTGTDLEGQRSGRGSIRHRPPPPTPTTRALTRVGTLLHAAHAQDFERRKKPEVGPSGGNDEDDEDDDYEEGSDEDSKRRGELMEEDVEDIARAEGLISRVSMESPQPTARGS
ncbi:Xenotropic and polytropic retrovirus receptor 1 [Diplodia seriata]|uniref:Xenotropic and polytropic retrovirus receptor 1 n=1 Tax=Diplodia seriata TaxID=420778 RepID=A0ABR3CEJ8_9PEZI